MEEKKNELTEELDQVVGGTDTTGQTTGEGSNPFANMPRVDTNPYTPDVTDRV